MAVAASLIVVPIMAPKGDKAFWTFCAFTASLMILLFVTSLVSGRNWFWLVSSAVLFGLSVCFLPFVIRARQVQKWVGKCNKLLLVLGVDAALFLKRRGFYFTILKLRKTQKQHIFEEIRMEQDIFRKVTGLIFN